MTIVTNEGPRIVRYHCNSESDRWLIESLSQNTDGSYESRRVLLTREEAHAITKGFVAQFEAETGASFE